MRPLVRIAVLALLLAALSAGAFSALAVRVPPGRVGVLQDRWGGGVQPVDHGSGFHLGARGKSEWYLLPAATQVLEFSTRADGGHRLEVRTSDNNTALLSLTVTWRILPGSAHRIVQEGLERSHRSQVKNTVESVLRRRLSELSSVDWFDSEARRAKLAQIETELDAELAGDFAAVDRVLVHDVAFSTQFEAELQSKQILYQQELQLETDTDLQRAQQGRESIEQETAAAVQAASAAAEEERQLLRAEHQREIATISARTLAYSSQQRSEADRLHAERIAEGQLAFERAEALGDRLRLEVLDSVGGRRYLAQRAAGNLSIEHVTLNSNDPEVPSILDLDQLVELLVGSDG